MLPDEGEESRPLVLPDCRPPGAGDDEAGAVRVTGELGQQGSHRGGPQPAPLLAVLVTPVTFLV